MSSKRQFPIRVHSQRRRKRMTRKMVLIILVLVIVTAAFVPGVRAQAKSCPCKFTISIANMIKADEIGYPSNYQFVFSIYTDRYLYRQFLLRRWQRVETQLPSGWYAFELSNRKGKVLARTGYYYIPSGAQVRWQSNLGPGLTPQIRLRVK
jgi:hypothetical protein